ncbi:hypothetical protein BDV06DRAFT_157692 [Aspergillus oleicola]
MNYNWKLQFSTLLVVRLWTLQVKCSLSGWNFNIQVKNVVASDAPIIEACRRGNINEVRRPSQLVWHPRMTVMRMEPVFLTDLLEFAAANGRLELCRLLIDNGANPDNRDNYAL